MNNVILGCSSVSLLLMIMSISPYRGSIGTFFPHQAAAENLSMGIDLVKVLVGDSVQALKSKDVNAALLHLKLIDQQLGISGNSVPILTSRVLVQDAIQALQNGDTNRALSHVLLANQELGSPVAPGAGQGNLIVGSYTPKIVNSGSHDNHRHNHAHTGTESLGTHTQMAGGGTPGSTSCDPKNCISDPIISAITKGNDSSSSPDAGSGGSP